MQVPTFADLVQISEFIYEIPKTFREDMRVPARVYMTKEMFEDIKDDRSLVQLVNVATLPGILKYALAMPDIHQGYGFPIGGVAAMAIDQGGVISPGGIGYDINCGVRLLTLDMTAKELQPYIEKLATALFHAIPSGVGRGGKLKFSTDELDLILQHGAKEMVKRGYGTEQDLEFCEEKGCMPDARPDLISDRAKKRGSDQLGTLGSGNHFLEVQAVNEIFNEQAAQIFGLQKEQVVIMIHCGSRGLGHQVCTDYVKKMMAQASEFDYKLPDRELIYAPVTSQIGSEYFGAMIAASNFAWANRNTIGHWVREVCKTVLGSNVLVRTVYDVSHNIGKKEIHTIDGKQIEVMMHRKGATRAFGPGTPETPAGYQSVGQPVLIPGTMGTSSYILVGTQEGMKQAFGSSCHGAGRKMSRTQAKKTVRGSDLRTQLEQRGIVIHSDSDPGLAEEAPLAYKDVDTVVQIVHGAGLAHKVAKVRPLAVVKGG